MEDPSFQLWAAFLPKILTRVVVKRKKTCLNKPSVKVLISSECCAHRRDEGKVHVPCNLLCKFSNLHMGGKRDWRIEF